MKKAGPHHFLIGGILILLGLLLYGCIFYTPGRVQIKTDAVIKTYLPRVQAFLEKNREIIGDIMLTWRDHELRLDESYTDQLGYIVYSLEDAGQYQQLEEELDQIPMELRELLDQVTGDESERIVINFFRQGIEIDFGFFTYTEVILFPSEFCRIDWAKFTPDEKFVFDLGDGWIAAFLGAARG